MKLKEIKAELAKMLMKFETIKTDKAVLEYDGELAVATKVFVVEDEERIPATDGDYVLEDGRTLVVADGEIKEIKEAVEPEIVEPEVEETKEEEIVAEEEIKEEEEIVEPEVEETKEEEEIVEPTELEKKITELEGKVAELETLVKKLVSDAETQMKDIEEKFSKMSLAKPAAEEFENQTKPRKTGDAKIDRFIERYGNK